jgi:hypothetical protein
MFENFSSKNRARQTGGKMKAAVRAVAKAPAKAVAKAAPKAVAPKAVAPKATPKAPATTASSTLKNMAVSAAAGAVGGAVGNAVANSLSKRTTRAVASATSVAPLATRVSNTASVRTMVTIPTTSRATQNTTLPVNDNTVRSTGTNFGTSGSDAYCYKVGRSIVCDNDIGMIDYANKERSKRLSLVNTVGGNSTFIPSFKSAESQNRYCQIVCERERSCSGFKSTYVPNNYSCEFYNSSLDIKKNDYLL